MTTRMADDNVATTEDDADVDDGAAHHGGQMSTPTTNADAAEDGRRGRWTTKARHRGKSTRRPSALTAGTPASSAFDDTGRHLSRLHTQRVPQLRPLRYADA
jgi:hypothetical protein